jgi:hypothetical protein
MHSVTLESRHSARVEMQLLAVVRLVGDGEGAERLSGRWTRTQRSSFCPNVSRVSVEAKRIHERCSERTRTPQWLRR